MYTTRKDGARPALFLIFVLFYVFFCVVLCIFVLFYVFFVLFYVFLCCSMYCLFCVVLCIVCVYMCIELLPPGGYPIAVKYIISSYICPSFSQSLLAFSTSFLIQATNTYRRLHRDSYHTFWWYFFMNADLELT